MKKSIYMQPAVEVVRTEAEQMICFSKDGDSIIENVGDKILDGEITGGNLGKDDDSFAGDIFGDLW